MTTETWDASVLRMKQIAERDGIISYPDVVNIIRGALDYGGITVKERENLQQIALSSNSFRAKQLVYHFVEALRKHNMLDGKLKLPAIAANRVCDFLMKSDPGKFPGLEREEVGIGILMRIANPGLINQGQGSLCGPASLLFSLIKRDPMQYVNFAADLFDKGRARLGRLEIVPGSDCRNYRPPVGSIPPVDWLTLASLRDSENWFFDYDSVGDQLSGITLPGELATWFRKAGFTDVYGDSETWRLFSQAPTRLIDKANELQARGFRVCFLINDQLMHQSTQAGKSIVAKHWVVLTSRIQRSPSIKFTVFSWGQGEYAIPHPQWNAAAGSYSGPTRALSENDLREHLFGVVAAKP